MRLALLKKKARTREVRALLLLALRGCWAEAWRYRFPRGPNRQAGCCHWIVSVTVVVWVTPPPVPVTVMVRVPVRARLLTLTVIVEEPAPGAATELGLRLMLTLVPPPEADKLIAELKPPEIAVVMVDVPELPRVMLRELGEALIVKLGFVPVTVKVTVVVCAMLPEVPLTVMA
jgi:hypothetical protein